MKIIITESQLYRLKKQNINEDLLYKFTDKHGYRGEVYVNPKTTKRFDTHCRAYGMEDGNLFVIDDGWTFIHRDLFISLYERGYIKDSSFYLNIDRIIPLQKRDRSDTFYLSEIFSPYYKIKNNINKISRILKKVKEKNPQYLFKLQCVSDYGGILLKDKKEYVEI